MSIEIHIIIFTIITKNFILNLDNIIYRNFILLKNLIKNIYTSIQPLLNPDCPQSQGVARA